MDSELNVLTKDGPVCVADLISNTEILAWNETKLVFAEVIKIDCKSTPSMKMVQFATESGNSFVVASTQDFMTWVDGMGEAVPAYVLGVGSKLFAANRNGRLVDDEVVEIGPTFGMAYTYCRLRCPESHHPVLFAGGLGIISH